MPSQKNIQLLEELKQKVDRSTAMFFVDYAGLTHRQMEEARRELAAVESELTVAKNTLLNLALKDLPAGRQAKKAEIPKLEGPHATLFSYKDPIATVKILAALIKKYGLPKIRFGIFEGGIVDEEMIIKLSTLPPREVLIAKFLGTLNAPISGLVYALNGNIQKLALVLDQIKNKIVNIKNTN